MTKIHKKRPGFAHLKIELHLRGEQIRVLFRVLADDAGDRRAPVAGAENTHLLGRHVWRKRTVLKWTMIKILLLH